MKRFLSMLLAAAMLFACTACAGKAEAPEPAAAVSETAAPEASAPEATVPEQKQEKRVFANVTPLLSDSFHANVDQTLRQQFEGTDVEVVTSNCEQDAQLQLEQLESYITMDVDYIYIEPLDMLAVKNALIEARQKGIQVYIYGSDPGDPEMYDAFFAADEYELGDQCAKAAAEWIDAAYADAADDSVEVAIFDFTAFKALSIYQRIIGMQNFETYSSKGKVVEMLDPGTDITPVKFQELTNTCMLVHPNVKAILTWAGGLGSAVNESLLMMPGLDYAGMWVGATDWNSLLGDMLKEAKAGNSPFRCAIGFENPAFAVHDVVMGEMTVPENKWVPLKAFTVTTENLDEYYGKY